jgi:two-component system sensor histidine kinase/response regulator
MRRIPKPAQETIPMQKNAKKKILVIDDEVPMCDFIGTALHPRFDFTAVNDGQDGVQTATFLQPDLILCDVNMSGVDGYQTLHLLRENPLTCHTPCILMTGQRSESGWRKGMELGADDYLLKPFTVGQLHNVVNVRLAKHDSIKHRAEEKFRNMQRTLATSIPNQLLAPMDDLLALTELIGKGYRAFDYDEIVAMARDAHRVGVRVRQQVENCLLFAELMMLAEDPARPSPWRARSRVHVLDIVEPAVVEMARQHQRLPDLQMSMSYCQSHIAARSLQKIVQEMLDNAMKYSNTKSPVEVRAFPSRTECIVEIADRGPGITPEQLDKLDAFVRFEEKLADDKGCGLGLAIARRLAELNGGRLTLTTRESGGTIAHLALPGVLHPAGVAQHI